jgi:hypothetical protein
LFPKRCLQAVLLDCVLGGTLLITFVESYLARSFGTGLPDGFFSNQKSKFGQILEGLRWENVDIYFRPFGIFTDIWDIL